MINPSEVTNYNRTEQELEEFLLFSIVTAGKDSGQQAKKLDGFLRDACALANPSPLKGVRDMCSDDGDEATALDWLLRCHKIGQYDRITRAFKGVAFAGLNLRSCTIADLEAIHGIGPKTARFFILHSRPNVELAVLDTHILKWLYRQGVTVPKSTPTGARYLTLERRFLGICHARDMSPAELDLAIWNAANQGGVYL